MPPLELLKIAGSIVFRLGSGADCNGDFGCLSYALKGLSGFFGSGIFDGLFHPNHEPSLLLGSALAAPLLPIIEELLKLGELDLPLPRPPPPLGISFKY